MDSSASSSGLGFGKNLRKPQLQEVAIRLLIFGFLEFGPAGEAFLGRPETVVQAAARMRHGAPLKEVALALVYREARSSSAVLEELVAWLAGRLMGQHWGLVGALWTYPLVPERSFPDHLLGHQAKLLVSGSFPGQDALVDKFASLLKEFPSTPPKWKTVQMERLVLAMFLLPPSDREVLRRFLAGEDAAGIAEAMGWSRLVAERTVARVLRNARRRARKGPPEG